MDPTNNNTGIICQPKSFSEENKKKLYKQKQATDLFIKQLPPIINENDYTELKNKIKKQTGEDINFNSIDENGETLFMRVIQMKNHFPAYLLLQEETLDLKKPNNAQFTCFFYAAMNDKTTPLLKKMCEKDPEAMRKKARHGTSLLHIAAQSASFQTLKYLHEIQNFSIHDLDERKWTPLHFAAKNDQNLDNLIYLIEKKANPYAINNEEYNVMELAGCYGAFKIVKYLYEKQKMPLEDKSYKISPLGATIAGGEDKNLQLIKYLLDKKVNPLNITCSGGSGIIGPIRSKNLKLLELFFDRGVKIFDKINENQVPLFHFIAAFASQEVLQFVINYTQKPKTNQNKLKKNITSIKLDKSFNGLVNSEDPFNALEYALSVVRASNLENIKILCKNGFSPKSITPKEKYTPLHLSCGVKNEENLEFILSCKPNINALTSLNKTPLMIACEMNFAYAAKKLIEKKALLNIKDHLGMTALHYACVSPDALEITQSLIEAGADLQIKNNEGQTPFMLAVKKQNLKAIQALYNKNQKVLYDEQPNNRNILHSAVISLQEPLTTLQLLVLLLKKDNTLQKLINQHTQPTHHSPVMYAIGKNDLETIKFLVNEGANLHVKDHFDIDMLSFAASKGYLDVLKYLVEEKNMSFEGNEEGTISPLLLASSELQTQVLEYLISKGVNPNPSDKEGKTLLFNMAIVGKSETIKFFHETYDVLLEPEKITPENFNLCPLVGALHAKQYETFETLIQLGASYQFNDKNNFTPFHILIQKGPTHCVSLLLEKGVDIYAQTKCGDTAVSLAIQENRLDVLELLIKKDPKLLGENDPTNSPLLLSANKKNWEALKFLIKYGAEHFENWDKTLNSAKEKIESPIIQHVFHTASAICILAKKQSKLTKKNSLIEKQKTEMQTALNKLLNVVQEEINDEKIKIQMDNIFNSYKKIIKWRKKTLSELCSFANEEIIWQKESASLIESISMLQNEQKNAIDKIHTVSIEKILQTESEKESKNFLNEAKKEIKIISMDHKKKYQELINTNDVINVPTIQTQTIKENLQETLERENSELNKKNKSLQKEIKKLKKLLEQKNNIYTQKISNSSEEIAQETKIEFKEPTNHSEETLKYCIKENCEEFLKINKNDRQIKKILKKIKNLKGPKIQSLIKFVKYHPERASGGHATWEKLGEESFTVSTHPGDEHDPALIKKVLLKVLIELKNRFKELNN